MPNKPEERPETPRETDHPDFVYPDAATVQMLAAIFGPQAAAQMIEEARSKPTPPSVSVEEMERRMDDVSILKGKMADEWRGAALPVRALSTVLTGGSGLPSLAVHLSAMPTPEQAARMPDVRDGIDIYYYDAHHESVTLPGRSPRP